MDFQYSQDFIDSALTYRAYRQHLDVALEQPAADEAAAKMQSYTQHNVSLMQRFDTSYKVNDALKHTLEAAPATIWLVLTEGWCGDAAFSVPMMAAVEQAVPGKVRLGIFLRDSHPELMNAHLTDGGRSIPKLIILTEDLKELGTWGPRPAGLQIQMKGWKEQGLNLKALIPRVHAWYDADATQSIQEELKQLFTPFASLYAK